MRLASPTILGAFAALTCFAALAFAYFFLQNHLGLNPCPLCIIDRWIIGAIGCGFLCIAISSSPLVHTISLVWNSLFMLLAFIVGGRHLWLEANPIPLEESGSCAPGAASQSLVNWLTDAFVGTSDCSLVPWRLLGLSVAAWTMVFFVVLALLIIFTAIACQKNRHLSA